jgi:hypothetical protein
LKGTYYRGEYGRAVGAVVEDGALCVFIVDGEEHTVRLPFDEAVSFAREVLALAAGGKLAHDTESPN